MPQNVQAYADVLGCRSFAGYNSTRVTAAGACHRQLVAALQEHVLYQPIHSQNPVIAAS